MFEYIDKYPATNYPYRRFIKETGHRKPLLPNDPDWNQPMQPVVIVGWKNASPCEADVFWVSRCVGAGYPSLDPGGYRQWRPLAGFSLY